MITNENIALVIYSGETDDVKSVEIVGGITRDPAMIVAAKPLRLEPVNDCFWGSSGVVRLSAFASGQARP